MADFTWRDLEGENPDWGNSPNEPDPPIPHDLPIYTPGVGDNGPWGMPWIDGLENPDAVISGIQSSPDPQIDRPDVGAVMGPGDYRGEYRTLGPVRAWGLEPSGGWSGDQAIGRMMRFPANIPERYDANGVYVGDYRDILASTMAAQNRPAFTDTNVVEDLVQWMGPVSTFNGWEG